MRLTTLAPCLVALAVSLPFLPTPLGRDQGYFAYGGWRILEGELPYRDFWANTFPGVFWWYALQEVLGIPHALGNGLVVGLTGVGLARLAGIWAGLGYALLCPLRHRFWDMGQAEQLLNLFVVWAMVVRRPLASGALAGMAVLCKPTAVCFFPLLGWGRERVLGLVAALFVAAVPYVPGGLARVWEDLVTFNASYGASRWDAALGGRVARHLGDWAVGLLPLFPWAGLGVWRRRRVGLWLALALASVVVQGKLFSYHWVVALPPLVAAAGLGLRHGLARRWLLGPALLASVVPWAVNPALASRTWYPALEEATRGLRRLAGTWTPERYLASFGDRREGADFSALDQRRVVEFLGECGCTSLLVWGFEPGINYLLKVPCPSPYVVDFPLTFSPRSGAGRVRLERERSRFLDSLHRAPPDCIVVVRGDANPVEPLDSSQQMREFHPFAEFVASHYRGPSSVASYEVWLAR